MRGGLEDSTSRVFKTMRSIFVNPIRKLKQLEGFHIKKLFLFLQTPICVDTYSLNYSETYWKNPEEFNPERFSAGRNPVPGSFFRFGMGPRKCLGYRYALAITRVVVTSFLQNFELQLSENENCVKVKQAGMPFFTPYLCPEIVLQRRDI